MRTSKSGAIIIEGHVQGLSNTRSLGEAGIPVYVVDKNNCLARYSRYCKKFFYCPNYIDPEFIDFLIELAKTEGLQGWALIPSNDHAVISISKNRSLLEKYYKIITPGIDVIENIYDKSKLLNVAQKVSIPFPKTYYLQNSSDIPSNIKFPVLTKGRHGLSFYKSTGKKVFLSNSASELKEHLIEIENSFQIGETFTQEYIPFDGTNKTISFTAFCINGDIKTYWIGEKLREHPIRFGTATLARSVVCEELIEPSKKLLQELNYTGVCEVEYLRNPLDGEYKLIEINARTWLWVGLAKACGVNFALMIYNHLNQNPFTYPSNYKTDVNWVNYITDSVFSLQAIIKQQLKLKQYFCAFKGKTVNAIFSWNDILPGIMFLFLSVYIAIKRK
jgi:predicted ATP-grasp superfamily ATP-dependent carboligase